MSARRDKMQNLYINTRRDEPQKFNNFHHYCRLHLLISGLTPNQLNRVDLVNMTVKSSESLSREVCNLEFLLLFYR